MRKSDGVRIAFFSLIENPLRTFLTLVGISIGVTAVIFVVSVIQGLNLYVGDTLSSLTPDVFVVDRFGLIKGHKEWIAAVRRNKDLHEDDANALRSQMQLASKVSVSQDTHRKVKYGSAIVESIEIRGISADSMDTEPFDVGSGRIFNPAEIKFGAYSTFVGAEVAEKLFGVVDPIGKQVKIEGRGFTIIGVAEKKGSAFGQSRDAFALIPYSTFGKIHGHHGSLSIRVKASDPKKVDQAIDEAKSILRARHHVKPMEDDDFGIITASTLMSFWEDLTRMIFRVAIFVVSISLVVGGIIIMNIMLLAVVERTREIGVRKAVGATSQDINFQFLMESIMLCGCGGFIGVVFAWFGTFAVRTYTFLPAQFPIWAPFLAVGISSAVGIFFGIHPARQAAHLDPIEALRSEEM